AVGAAAPASAVDTPAPALTDVPPAAPTDKGSNTGLPLPRYAAFRAGEVNMRSGPGERYPITWVYHRRDLPVRIEREFDVWRLVEDSDGEKGWVHQAVLTGTRTFVIPGLPPEGAGTQAGEASARDGDHIGRADTRVIATVPTAQDAEQVAGGTILRTDASDQSGVVAVLKPGVVGVIRQCPVGSDWCKVSVKNHGGWLHRGAFWGLLPQEAIQP
ncbi:SH3 domain-containing protein, partial [Ameyamaea chiangmaiensis]